MGDMVSFIENAVASADAKVEEDEAMRMATGNLNLNDFIEINRRIHKVGGIQKMVAALPGGDKALASGKLDTKALDRMEVIISSMTAEEREKPELLNGSRRLRIAKGAGVSVSDVNQVIKKFNEAKKLIKRQMAGMNGMSTKNKKGGKKGKGRRGRLNMPGIGGMSVNDLKNLQKMMDE